MKSKLTVREWRMKWTNRYLILMAVIFGLILIMSNGAIFLPPNECSGHVGILPPECMRKE